MRGSTVARAHWPASLVGVLIVALFVAAMVYGTDQRFGKAFIFTATAVPSVLAVAQYLYMRVDRWRLAINRLRLRVVNPEGSLRYMVEYDVENLFDAHATVTKVMKGATAADTRQLSRADDGEVWLWRGTTVQLHFTEFGDPIDGESSMLRVEVPSLKTSYRAIDRAIREDVGGLLAELERDVHATSRKYVVNLGFQGENPYFGLLVNNVNREMVHRFDIDIFETSTRGSGHDRVRIHKDEVELVSDTAHDTQLLALRYLSCQPLPARV